MYEVKKPVKNNCSCLAWIEILRLSLSPSAKGEGLYQPAGWGGEDFQLTAGDGGRVRPRANHPRNPPDLSRLEAFKGRGLLSADQTNQSRPPPKQPVQSRPLASPHLYELHLPAQPRHPSLPQVSPQKVQCMSGYAMIHNNPIVKMTKGWHLDFTVFVPLCFLKD